MKHTHGVMRARWFALILAPALAFGCSGEKSSDLHSMQQAATLNVPADYSTIQAAVDAASAGDIIQVAAGEYAEDVDVYNKPVKILGNANQRPKVFGAFYFYAADGSEVRNFEIRGPSSSRSGIRAYATSLTVDFVYVADFYNGLSFASTANGESLVARSMITSCTNGVALESGCSVQLLSNLLLFNSSRGAYVQDGATAMVVNNTVIGNGSFVYDNPAVLCNGQAACTLRNNILVSNDVGYSCIGSCNADYNLVWGNQTDYGLGTTPGSHDLSIDPRFTEPGEYDFHLQEDSPAIDAGDGVVFTNVDFDGISRPQGDGVDMGAYEYARFTSGLTLLINEIMSNPIDESTGEFVELYNYGSGSVDAAGLVIWDGDAIDELVGYQGGSTVIPAGGYAVILDPDYANEYTIEAGAVLLTVASSTTIGNGLSTSDPISLWEGNLITRIARFSFPFDPGNGVSVERVSIEEGDIHANWTASPCSASPGKENCASKPSNVSREVLIALNEIMANPLDEGTGEFIELYNFGDEDVDVAGFIITDGDANDTITGWNAGPTVLQPGDYGVVLDPGYADDYTIPGEAVLLTIADTATIGNGLSISDPVSLLDASGQSVIDTFSRVYDPGNGVSVEKVDPTVGDVPSNWAASSCPSGSSPGALNCVTGGEPVSGDTIAITEVMSNPLDEDTGEYVELYNYGDLPVDVAGWRLDDGDATDTLQAFGAGSTVIPAGGYALVLDAEYDNDYGSLSGVVLLTTDDTTIGTGLATTDPLRLRAASGSAVVDSFSFPFNPGNGISIEKIDLVVGDVPQNWTVCPCNSSPGEVNCAWSGGTSSDLSSTHVVISEVMANPLDEGSGEYIELFNAGPADVDVAGFILTDGDAIDVVQGYQGGGSVIPPGGYAVILDSGYASDYTIGAGAVLLTVGDATLGNGLSTNDPITLFEPDGATVVDTFSFPTNPGNGVSVEKATLTRGDQETNWRPSTCRKANGKANDFCSPGLRNCADPNSGVTGDNVTGEPCPYGAVDCLYQVCLIDLLSYDTYCSEPCEIANDQCPTGYHCAEVEDLWGFSSSEVCVQD